MTKEKVIDLSRPELPKLIELLPSKETTLLIAKKDAPPFTSNLRIPTPDIDNYVRNPYGDK